MHEGVFFIHCLIRHMHEGVFQLAATSEFMHIRLFRVSVKFQIFINSIKVVNYIGKYFSRTDNSINFRFCVMV